MRRRRNLGIWMGAVVLVAAPVLFARAANPPLQAKSQPAKSSQTSSTAKSNSGQKAKAPAKKRRVSRRRPRGQQAPSADRIKEIQTALAREGHYQGEPTGKWDAATIQAIKSYQQASELTPSGKLDAKTLQRLGLGSGIAGQAPPRTPASTDRASDNPRN